MEMRKYIPAMEGHYEKLFECRGFILKEPKTKVSRISFVRQLHISYNESRKKGYLFN